MKIFTLIGALIASLNHTATKIAEIFSFDWKVGTTIPQRHSASVDYELTGSLSKFEVHQREEGKNLDFDSLDTVARDIPLELAAAPLNKTDREEEI